MKGKRDRGRKTEDGGRKLRSKVKGEREKGQRTEDGGRRAEIEVKGQRGRRDRGLRAEDGRRRTEGGGQGGSANFDVFYFLFAVRYVASSFSRR